MNWIEKFENRFFRIRALPRNIQASIEIVRKEIGPALEKKQKRFLSSQCALETLYIAMVAMTFV